MGYHDVRHYAGGISDWVEHGGPVESAGVPLPAARPAPAGTGGRPQTPAPPRPDWLAVRLLDTLANRSLGAMLAAWLGMVFGCAAVYWLLGFGAASLVEGGAAVPATLEGLGTALYFSFITATSVGYGDVTPLGLARALAAAESAAGLILFGCVISRLVSRRQEQLVEQIHSLAFENQLGRVRTNLHMVLSELQTLSGECVPATLSPERALPRLESTAVVFAGELRAIHDLLYRPEQAPEEIVLETILAILSAGLEGLRDLLQKLPTARERSQPLRTTLHSISVLAGEICGSCVPREYAPEMRVWLDRIQGLASAIEPESLVSGGR